MVSDSDNVWYQRLEAQWAIPAILGFLYTVGFLVTNTHRALYQPVHVEIFEARYFGAALLYSVFTAVPVMIGVYAMREVKKGEADANLDRLLRWVGFTFVLLAMLFLLIRPPYQEPGFQILLHSVAPGLGYCLLIALGTFAFFLHRAGARAEQDEKDEEHFRLSAEILGLFIVFLFSTFYFGGMVYPRVSPAFGGGAQWIASVELKNPIGARYTVADSVMILDNSQGFQTVLSCVADGGQHSSQVLAFPNTSIDVLHYGRVASSSAYIRAMDRFGCPEAGSQRGGEELEPAGR